MNLFIPFSKVPRLSRSMTITEKIDGTNASVWILDARVDPIPTGENVPIIGHYAIRAGSRKRFVMPGQDNFGFAAWVWDHAEELIEGLGVGIHYGEWWGRGIQRKYDQDRKRFSLFNTDKWEDFRPECCDVVPTLYQGAFSTWMADRVMNDLKMFGSSAAPGFMNPEGVIVWHHGAQSMFKKTFESDAKGKGGS